MTIKIENYKTKICINRHKNINNYGIMQNYLMFRCLDV